MKFIAVHKATTERLEDEDAVGLAYQLWGRDVSEFFFRLRHESPSGKFNSPIHGNPPVDVDDLAGWLFVRASEIIARYNKPIAGLMPREEWLLQREEAIYAAMRRYVEANKVIPMEWIEELEELNLPDHRLIA